METRQTYSGNMFRMSLRILASTEKDFKLDEKKKETVKQISDKILPFLQELIFIRISL